MENIDYVRRSLNGVWIGDCIGNLGQLYFVHDILKALEAGIAKFGSQLNQFQKQFVYSDDTEEAIVLYNHLLTNKTIDQDKLAMEFATRYWTRDPDGEIYGYGLNTRKVLKDIYDGIPWNEANKIIPKSEGMPSHIDSLVDSLSKGDDYKNAMHKVNDVLRKEVADRAARAKEKQGSCGNGSAMRVAPLGAYLAVNDFVTREFITKMATLQSQPTHCHPEGIAGSIAITTATAYLVQLHCSDELGVNKDGFLSTVFDFTPDGQVKDGLKRAINLPFETPIGKAIEVLGNGTHVTCQDTVPLCCWLTAKHLQDYPIKEDGLYERAIIDTSMAFGDVDTNCAIVGGMLGTIAPPPEKWVNFCQPMEGVL